MEDQSTCSIQQRPQMSILPDADQFDRLLFGVEKLSLEIQKMIVIKAAVARRLSGETCGEVFAAMAPVCKRWLKLLKAAGTYEEVERETYLIDPTCQYLRTVQFIPITGVEQHISNVCALGDKLYIVVRLIEMISVSSYSTTSEIFSYNYDCTEIRHQEPSKRMVTCADRKRLMVNGLNASCMITGILPCTRTNTLYLLDVDNSGLRNTIVHHIDPDDGTVLHRWNLDLSINTFNTTTLSKSGSYIIITGVSSMLIYCALTGVLINRVDVTAESILNGMYLAATLGDDILEDLGKLASSIKYHERNIALDDHVILLLSQSGFAIVDTCTGRSRMLGDSGTIGLSSCWYDQAHGLIFLKYVHGLRVIRITY